MRTFQKFQRKSSRSLLIETPLTDQRGMRNYTYTESYSKPITKLYCPDCYNKNVSRYAVPTQPNESDPRRYRIKDEINFHDNHKKENEDNIRTRIADREQKAHEAFRSIDKFKNMNKEMLQSENESNPNFFRATDHNLERAKKKSKNMEFLLNKHLAKFQPQEKSSVNKYFEKCIGVGNNSCLIRSSSCPSLTKAQYCNSLKNQIALKEKMKIEEKMNENREDRENLNHLLSQNEQIFKARRAQESNMKQELAQENERIISLKQQKRLDDRRDDLRKENEELDNAQQKMNAYRLEMSEKKSLMNNICNYNRKMYLVEQEKKSKEKRDDCQYKNNGYIKDLLCEHGCQMVTCAECKKLFPKRVMTPIVIRKKK